MAVNQAIPTQGTSFTIGSGPGTVVGDVVSWAGPRFARGEINVTHLQSTAMEYLAGLKDAGEFTMNVNFNLGDAGQQAIWTALNSNTPAPVKVEFPDPGGSFTFNAIVKGFESAGNADDKITGAITLRITGDVTWAPAT
jgi:predicted secreted protein